MKGNRAAMAAVLAVVLALAGWWIFKRSTADEGIDLLAVFETAEKRPAPGAFETIDAEVGGQARRAIATQAPSRIIWRIHVPDDGWLRVALALKPEAWTEEGDGVYFRIGISDGRQYEELLAQQVNPFGHAGDRRWIPVMLDLSAFAREDVELIFNADNSPPGRGADPRADLALWGAPALVVR